MLQVRSGFSVDILFSLVNAYILMVDRRPSRPFRGQDWTEAVQENGLDHRGPSGSGRRPDRTMASVGGSCDVN